MPRKNAAEFAEKTIKALYKQAGERCSLCGLGTSQPHTNSDEYINLGEAAHIEGEKKAPNNRYNPNMTDEQRKGIKNGIWLCLRCHKIIDRDDKKYTVDYLLKRKGEHLNRVKTGHYDKLFPDYFEKSALAHDKKLFRTGERIMNEEKLNSLLKLVMTRKYIYSDNEDLRELLRFNEFYNLEGNQFINKELQSTVNAFISKITSFHLLLLISRDSQIVSFLPLTTEKSYYGLKPFSEVPIFSSYLSNPISPTQRTRYEMNYRIFTQSLEKIITELRDSYRAFRKKIKGDLII